MARWQRRARAAIAIFTVVFAAIVVRQLKHRDPPPPSSPVARTDPGAVIETTGGNTLRFTGNREDVRLTYKNQRTYADGTNKLSDLTIVTDARNGSRTFTITSKDGQVGKNDSAIALDGNVRLEASDGMTAAAERATYAKADGMVRAPGPVTFARGRIRGTGVGLTWDQTLEVLTILEQAVVHIAPDNAGGGAEVTAGAATFARKEKYIRFERSVKIDRGGQTTEADAAMFYLSADEQRIESIDLKEHARITAPKAAPGAMQSLSGHDMNLKYAGQADVLQHALISGDALIRIAGERGKSGREIAANVLDITLGPDGTLPTALVGRDAVLLTLPPEGATPGRTISAVALDAAGAPGKGLTKALFTGAVKFRERGSTGNERQANADSLELALKPALGGIDQAKFAHNVRFEDGSLTALSAAAAYDPEKGTLALSGSEKGTAVPHVVNEQLAVDATTIDLTLDGPRVKANGNVKSTLQPASKTPAGGAVANEVKLPSMLKQDQPVSVLADNLDYDGTASKGTYTGKARLFQGDTSIKGDTIVVDDKLGNLSASGSVTTTTVLEQTGKDQKKERVHSIATSKEFKYDDAQRRLTYLTDAHMSSPEADMTAARIELYLKPSGDELERAEAYDSVTVREQNRETTGSRMIYTTANETYVFTGIPVKIVDECKRETIGKTLTFNKGTDRIVVDGNAQIRTQTKGGNSNCTT